VDRYKKLKNFVLVTIFISHDAKAHRYLMFQVRSPALPLDYDLKEI
jgi:hypothetical protein